MAQKGEPLVEMRRPRVVPWPQIIGSRKEGVRRTAYRTLLICVVVAGLIPAISYDNQSRVFLVKLFFVGFFALLPGWLYVRFVKNLSEVYVEYVINLFRLQIDRPANLPAPPQYSTYYPRWKMDHDMLRSPSKDNLYRKKFEDAYGSAPRPEYLFQERQVVRYRGKKGAETFSSVLLLTILLCVGWALVIQPDPYRSLSLLENSPFSGPPELPYRALMFGFFGAYTFILQDLVRRYYRNDLKTAAYVGAVVRLIVVTLLVSAIQLLPGFDTSPQSEVIAFLIGFFPQAALQILRASVGRLAANTLPNINPGFPLNQLDGVNIWYEARLLEDGIEDMQNLITVSLVDLILLSRAPIDRLVDWVDQSCLLLHISKAAEATQGASASSANQNSSTRERLRQLGIRTATDFERVWDKLHNDATFRKALCRALEVDEETGRAIAKAIRCSLDGELSLWHVRQYKRYEWLPERELAVST
jgi:hypothetical protein